MKNLLTAALLLCFLGCVHGPTQSGLEHQAGDLCWKLRETSKDWRLAATTCAQELKKMDGVKAAWVDGSTVRVKFDEYDRDFGIWMR